MAILFAPSAAPADTLRPQTAEDVVARYLDAIGGARNLRDVKTLRLTGKHREQGLKGPDQSLCVPASLPRSRSKVPSGRWPAFRATSRIRQSEKP